MEKKPVKIEDGHLKEFNSDDDLPNQPDVDTNTILLAKLVETLLHNGIEIEDEELLDLLKYTD